MCDNQLLQTTLVSVNGAPITDLLNQPIRIDVNDVCDLAEFKFSLDSAFTDLGINITPDQIIDFFDPEDDVVDSWDELSDDDDDFELSAFGAEPCAYLIQTQTLHSGKVITLKGDKPKRVIKDDYDYHFRPILPQSDKTWEPLETPPPSPLDFDDTDDIVYPPTPPLPEEPFKNERFENFITNGQLRQDGRFKGVIPTPYNLVFSIKVQQALDLQITELKDGGFTIVAKPMKSVRPRLLSTDMMRHKPTPRSFQPKSQICKHGSSCKFLARGTCRFAHRLKEWQPHECTKCEKSSMCDLFHPEFETKKSYYKRRHQIK